MKSRTRLMGLALAGGLVSVPVPAHATALCPAPGSGFFDHPSLCHLSLPEVSGLGEAGRATKPDRATRPDTGSKPDTVTRRLKGEVAAAAALARVGTPFSWGGGSRSGPTRGIGRGAATVGFDCSGLTMYAWGRAGVRLGHYTGTQFRQGRRVPLSRLRSGDLVFFGGGTGDPSHVGLYLRAGLMVHAPKTGDVVKVVRFLRSPYFGSVYRGAVRPG
ncbi:NlpC/P60 family protein [Nonomuraea sp. C10]|uniref:NlpC/P60 family protein n=1 Tax=Nonomuraea sp. C10 TaxID=2600577 RepID=UPI0011CDC7AF|nr:NlpC/P60 family protein [Nonomuraea sp. C10]TXK38267.1 NlpC/P60 family protein [Nonomuraea sp. C10]